METYYMDGGNSPYDVDMFGESLGDLLDQFQGEAASQVTGRDDPSFLAGWCVEMRYIASKFTELADAFERQFKDEFGFVIEN